VHCYMYINRLLFSRAAAPHNKILTLWKGYRYFAIYKNELSLWIAQQWFIIVWTIPWAWCFLWLPNPCLFYRSDNFLCSWRADAPRCAHFSIHFTPSWIRQQISVEKFAHGGAWARRERQTMFQIVTQTKQAWILYCNAISPGQI